MIKMNFFHWFKSSFIRHKHIIVPMLVVILLPNILGFLFGAEYSNYPFKNVDTIIVNHDESAMAMSLVKMIKENETFNVIAESTENSQLEEYIRTGKAMAGIIIPDDFTYNITHGKEAKIMVFNDGALSSSGSTIRAKVSETLGTIKAGYMIKVAEGTFNMSPQTAKYVVSPFGYKTRTLGNPTSNIANMMVEGVLLTTCQMTMFGLTAFIRGKKNFGKMLGKVFICAFVTFLIAVMTVVVQTVVFKTPYNGSIALGLLIIALTAIGFSLLGMFVNLGAKHGPEQVIGSIGLINLTMLFSGYTFPVFAMPKVFSHFEFWMPNRHIIIPLRSVALLGCDFDDIKGDILWLVVFVIIMFAGVCYKFFISPKVTEKKKLKKQAKQQNLPLNEVVGD